MLAKVYCGQAPSSYLVEPKIDGVRVIITADLDSRRVTFPSRPVPYTHLTLPTHSLV